MDGIDLREATHELAVNTFRSSGDPVKMVVRRSVRKALTSGGVTAQVDFVATKENNVAADVVLRAEKNKLNKEYSSSNGNGRREKNSNRRGWFSPEEISGSPAEDLSSSCNEVFVADHLSEQNTAKNSGGDKEEYDSAYDTLMTNKSSRCSHHSSTVADVSSDVESTSTERTLEAVDDKEGVQQRKQYSPLRQQQREQRDSARENSSDSCEKRRSTFFIIPESGAGGSVGVGGDNKTTTASLEDFNGSTGVPDDDFDYEYEVCCIVCCCFSVTFPFIPYSLWCLLLFFCDVFLRIPYFSLCCSFLLCGFLTSHSFHVSYGCFVHIWMCVCVNVFFLL